MTSGIIAISIGAALLSLLVGYFFGVRLRQARLQVELLNILLTLRQRVKETDDLSDPQYIATKRLIEAIIENVDVVSLLGFVYYAATYGIEVKKVALNDFSGGTPLEKSLREARNNVGITLLTYVLFETASGVLVRFIAWLIPKAAAAKNLRAGIKTSVDAFDHLSHGTAGC